MCFKASIPWLSSPAQFSPNWQTLTTISLILANHHVSSWVRAHQSPYLSLRWQDLHFQAPPHWYRIRQFRFLMSWLRQEAESRRYIIICSYEWSSGSLAFWVEHRWYTSSLGVRRVLFYCYLLVVEQIVFRYRVDGRGSSCLRPVPLVLSDEYFSAPGQHTDSRWVLIKG